MDDGKRLPPLPELPRSVEKIGRLHLQLLSDARDPDHLLWNRLIIRQHPACNGGSSRNIMTDLLIFGRSLVPRATRWQ
jgi:hypothetical protein